MSARLRTWVSFAEAFELPLVLDLRTAARVIGVCPATAYKLIHRGGFPSRVLWVGGQYRIPTADLLRAVGIEERPVYQDDLQAGAEYAQRSVQLIESGWEDCS
ncbi:helix-turn-helix domain-containing protein [Kitasatospora sp. NPDC006697]|uniref:helix-turn-helix domain-containing protein n=1 Tax=Kitasatospora sp. NPDC006697 TaxID=3364020 RepID=UPI0036BC119A